MRSTILCAEDERRIRQYIQEEMQLDGYRVLVAGDGIEALAMLDTRIVDLVILDEHMPRLSGLETAQRIKELDATLPIVLFTGDRLLKGLRSPYIDAVLYKTENLTQLKEEVAELLRDELAGAFKLAPTGRGTS